MSATKPPDGRSLVKPETRTRVRKLGEPVAYSPARLG